MQQLPLVVIPLGADEFLREVDRMAVNPAQPTPKPGYFAAGPR
jgi:hypothetical protein